MARHYKLLQGSKISYVKDCNLLQNYPLLLIFVVGQILGQSNGRFIE